MAAKGKRLSHARDLAEHSAAHYYLHPVWEGVATVLTGFLARSGLLGPGWTVVARWAFVALLVLTLVSAALKLRDYHQRRQAPVVEPEDDRPAEPRTAPQQLETPAE